MPKHKPIQENLNLEQSNGALIWFAFRIGCLRENFHMTSGRDALRAIRAIYDGLGLSIDGWDDFEKALIKTDFPFALSIEVTQHGAIRYLARRDCPIGPLERISG